MVANLASRSAFFFFSSSASSFPDSNPVLVPVDIRCLGGDRSPSLLLAFVLLLSVVVAVVDLRGGDRSVSWIVLLLLLLLLLRLGD